MPEATHIFVPCTGADAPKACKHNVLVPLAAFFDQQALASALESRGWLLLLGKVARTPDQRKLPDLICFAFCPECSAERLQLVGEVPNVSTGPNSGN